METNKIVSVETSGISKESDWINVVMIPSMFVMAILLLSGIGSVPVFATPAPETPSEEQSEPEAEPQPEPTPSEETTPPKTDLPKCDGSPQDCVTDNGDTCLKGQGGGHECECSEDMSDCPNHPSLQNEEAAQTSQDDINPCLLDPSLPSCPKPDPETQDCPPGWAQNEDGNCFPLHPEGCPQGYHGHEDDETGRCIPNSTPCDLGYEFNDDRTNCEREHFTCDGKPSVVPCETDNDDNDNSSSDNDDNRTRKDVIKNIHNTEIVKKIIQSDDRLSNVDQTIIAISYDEGAGINCVILDSNNGQCETFDGVTVDKGKEPLLQIIPFS